MFSSPQGRTEMQEVSKGGMGKTGKRKIIQKKPRQETGKAKPIYVQMRIKTIDRRRERLLREEKKKECTSQSAVLSIIISTFYTQIPLQRGKSPIGRIVFVHVHHFVCFEQRLHMV